MSASGTYPTNTQQLLAAGSVVHLHLVDQDEEGSSLVRVLYADTIGIAVYYSGYESWADYLGAVRADGLEPLPFGEPLKAHFYPWSRIDEATLFMSNQAYTYWFDQKSEAVAA